MQWFTTVFPAPVVALLLSGALALSGQPGGSVTYSGVVNDGGWHVEATPFECRMSNRVPFYGTAIFRTLAGIPATEFLLDTKPGRFAAGHALMLAQAPVWQPEQALVSLGEVDVAHGTHPVQLDDGTTEKMLLELHKGREIIIAREDVRDLRMPITNVGFGHAYESYLDCVAQLLPANFDQIRRTAIYFGTGQYDEVPEDEVSKLDHILRYAQADPYLKELYIDGHTDSLGTREDNLKISEDRARMVAEYLVKRGLPKDRMVIRWHGERYPVANNGKTDGRAQNRRVTIRLERVEPVKMPSLAASSP